MPVTDHRFIGVDIGTTGVRAVAFDADARVVGEADREYPLYTPKPGWAEQDADEVADATVACLRGAVRRAGWGRREPVAVGVSGTFHSVLPIDDDGRPVGRALTWADTRAADDAAAIRREAKPRALYERTGCPVHPMYLPAKLRWLRRHTPAARGFRSIKEYVLYRLTGEWACDLSVASGTGMLDMARRTWDDQSLELAGTRAAELAPLVETLQVVGRLTAESARAARLSGETVVVAGAGDGVLASLGSGSIHPGQMTATIGTSGAVRLVTAEPKVDAQARTWCYYLAPERWVAGAAINNAGLALRWTTEKLLRAGRREYDRLIEWASEVPPGAGGLLFLPFLTGERAPYWNADARGVFFGFALDHDYRNAARATLEGVCLRMRSVADALIETAGPVSEVRVTGGFTRSQFWLQLLADILQQPLHVPSVQEVSALGAAEMAMVAVGALPNLEATTRFVRTTPPVRPDAELAEVYQRIFDLYMQVYWRLTDQFGEIARFQRGDPPSSPAGR